MVFARQAQFCRLVALRLAGTSSTQPVLLLCLLPTRIKCLAFFRTEEEVKFLKS